MSESFLMFSEPQISLNPSIIPCHGVLVPTAGSLPFSSLRSQTLRGALPVVMPPHATLGLVAYVKSTNFELCCLLSRLFSPRKPSLTFAAQVWLQKIYKIYSACPETEHTHPQQACEEKAGESHAPHVPRAPAVSVIQQPSRSDPLSPLNSGEP